jgi:two-component system, NarL family, nitrate/nitrite response regulator NarL
VSRSAVETRSRVAGEAGESLASVLLVDPFPLVRAGLAGLIRQRGEMRVLAEAGTAEEALQHIRANRRRGRVIVLVSLAVQGEHDAEWLLTHLREEFPSFVSLAVGRGTDALEISRALFMGADGFIDAKAQPDEFLDALRQALEGQLVLAGIPSELFGSVVEGIGDPEDAPSILTAREREILSIAAEGLTAREIGLRLSVSERTVTTHLGNVYRKLGVNGRIAALNWAVRSGFIAVDWPSAGSETA